MSELNKPNEQSIDVKCKNCHRLLFRQSNDASGVIEIKCKNRKRVCKISLPIR